MFSSNTKFKFLLLLIFIFMSTGISSQMNEGAKLENVLAVYIYNFTKLLDWRASNSENFYITVLGKSRITEPLNKIAENEKVKGKKIIVNEVSDIDNLNICDILFVEGGDGNGDKNNLNDILKKIKDKNILLITNSEGYAERGAGINFLRENEKVKFEINRKVLEKSGIVPNSRLLSIAVKVYD